MRCKKEIMGLAALMVLFFHFYMPGSFSTTVSAFETFLYRASFVGVDLFFFVSAYSITSRNTKEEFHAGKFILNRFSLIYVPFIILSIIYVIYRKLSFVSLLKIIGGVEFYERGGGAFLWYFTGIMVIYLLVPLFLLIKRRFKLLGFPLLLVFWVIVSCILQFGFNYTKAFIFINRLPIFFIGMYFDELVLHFLNKLKTIYQLPIELILLVVGSLLTNKFAVTSRLNKPFGDMYYVIAIPLIIAIALLVNTITTMVAPKYKSIVLKFLGGITLELYGLQMIFGYDIESKLLSFLMKNVASAGNIPSLKLVPFIGVIIALIGMAVIFNFALRYARKLFAKIPTLIKQKAN